jgi:two-component system, OmpR family, heavy metal sensor histidine kinase CusS
MFSALADSEQPLGKPAPRRRWSIHPRSFRALVAAWNTLTILLFTIAILVGLRYGLSYMMLRDEDKLLTEDAAEIRLLLDRIGTRWDTVSIFLDRKANSHASRKWFGMVRKRDGTVLAKSNNVPDIELAKPHGTASTTQTIGSFRVTRDQYRMSPENVWVYVGATTEGIDENVGRLSQVIGTLGIVLLILAPLGGFLLATRVIRPLSNIIAQTAQLRPLNLEERLPIRATGDELDQLSATINGLLDRIAAYLDRHRELTANVAHELRSPLAAILSSAEVALNHERSSDEYKELLGSIVEEISRLGTLVNQLLMLAESDAGRLDRSHERVELDQLVLKAVDMFQGVAEARGIRLEAHVPGPVPVTGNAGYLRQVVQNLIDNAIKFTPSGVVRVEARLDSDDHGLLVVTDTGVGISAENLPFVFDRFYRGDQSRTRLATGGCGLGLSICKALVTAHGGTISIKSDLGHGTEVRVRFPGVKP